MAAAVKTCRVCGKNYEACRTMSNPAGVFRWQEVACSPVCGAEYLRRVTEARSPLSFARKPSKTRHAEAVKPAEAPEIEPVDPVPADTSAETPVDNA